MAKKSDDGIPVFAIIFGIFIYPFIWLYEKVGQFWFWFIVIAIPLLMLVVWFDKKQEKDKLLKSKIHKKTSMAVNNTSLVTDNISLAENNESQITNKSFDDYWLEHLSEIDDAWSRGDYDIARSMLQKIAYSMVGNDVTQQQKDDFTKLMTNFASEDPLYKEVMDKLLPMVIANQGITQSKIYQGQTEDIKEQMRYVIYFAEKLGHIKRIKKGNSYQLYMATPESVLQSSTDIRGADVVVVIYNFTQRCFIGEKNEEPLDLSIEDYVFEKLFSDSLNLLEVHQLPSKYRRLLREILSQYIIFLEMNRDLPFPPGFLDGSTKEQLALPLLQYIHEHRWPFPQMLPPKQ